MKRYSLATLLIIAGLLLGSISTTGMGAPEAISDPTQLTSPDSPGSIPRTAGSGPPRKAGVTQYGENVELMGHVGGYINTVAVQGHYAYIGEGPQLTILDISNPASPTVVGKTALLPANVQDIAIAGDYAYVTAGADGGLRSVTMPI